MVSSFGKVSRRIGFARPGVRRVEAYHRSQYLTIRLRCRIGKSLGRFTIDGPQVVSSVRVEAVIVREARVVSPHGSKVVDHQNGLEGGDRSGRRLLAPGMRSCATIIGRFRGASVATTDGR